MFAIKRRVQWGTSRRKFNYMLEVSPRSNCNKRGYAWGNESFSQASGQKLILIESEEAANEKIRTIKRADIRQYEYVVEPRFSQ